LLTFLLKSNNNFILNFRATISSIVHMFQIFVVDLDNVKVRHRFVTYLFSYNNKCKLVEKE